MKLRDLIARLQEFDPACDVQFLISDGEVTLGSVYDDTDPRFTPSKDIKPSATLVTIEIDG